MINIVGLGYGTIEDLTIRSLKILKENKDIYIKDSKHPVVKFLMNEGREFKRYNELFDNIKNYGEPIEDIVYAVSGNPLEDDELINICRKRKIKYRIYEATGIRELIERNMNNEIGKIDIINAHSIENSYFDRKKEIIITNLTDELIIKLVRLRLLQVYTENTYIYHIKIGRYDEKVKVCIKDIDNINNVDEESLLYIPKDSEGKKDIFDLAKIIEILRGKDGCPWDKEQSHESIKKDIIEESYEVFDAINNKDNNAIIEELGDVLFQIMFHASLGKENKEFTMLDITDGISRKMIYRHPHVFGNVNVENTAQVLANWDELKKGEKSFKSLNDELNGVAKALPALIRAEKVQKKAKKVGFDWDDIRCTFEKVKEELNEVIDEYKSEKMVRIKEEIGDLLFSCVNVSRFLDIDPEEALNITTDKFIKRLSYIEDEARKNHLSLEEMDLNDMDKLWNKAKKLENQ